MMYKNVNMEYLHTEIRGIQSGKILVNRFGALVKQEV